MAGVKQLVIFGVIALFLHLQTCDAAVSYDNGKDGGGECSTDSDCNNGVCEENPQKKSVCMCINGFSGQFCEDTTKDLPGKKEKAKKVEVEFTVKDVEEDKAPKRNLKDLVFDKVSDITDVTPETLEKANQPFMLYSPVTKKFVFVANDKTTTGLKRRNHVEAHSERYDERNMFTLKKAVNKAYYIHCVKKNMDLYVSNSKSGVVGHRSNDVLAVDSDADTKDKPATTKLYVEFEGDVQSGLYRLKTGDKYWFVSNDRSLTLNRVVEADTKYREKSQTQMFQLVIKDPAVKAEVEYDQKNAEETKTKELNVQHAIFTNTNKNGADLTEAFSYKRTVTDTAVYRQANELFFSGTLTAGVDVAKILKLGASFTVSNKKTTETTDTKAVAEEETVTHTIITKGGIKNCVTLQVTKVDIKVPYKMKVTTKEGKTLEASGTLEGKSHSNFEVIVDGIDYGPTVKCPWE
eukprot:gene618-1280_t